MSCAAVTRHARLLGGTRGCYAARAARGCYVARAAVTPHAGLKRIMPGLILLGSVLFSNVGFYFWIFCSYFKCIVLFFNVTFHFWMTCFVLFRFYFTGFVFQMFFFSIFECFVVLFNVFPCLFCHLTMWTRRKTSKINPNRSWKKKSLVASWTRTCDPSNWMNWVAKLKAQLSSISVLFSLSHLDIVASNSGRKSCAPIA